MVVTDPVYLIILIVSLIASSFATIFAWRRKSVAGARTFAVNSFIGVLQTLCVLLMVFSPSTEIAFFSLRLRLIIQTLAITTITLFILDYAGYTRWWSLNRFWIFFIFPIFSIVVAMTGLASQWFAIGYTIQRHDFLFFERYQNGPWLTIGQIYAFLVYGMLLVILAVQSVRSHPPFRWQALILFAIIFFTVFITIPSLTTQGAATEFKVSPIVLQTIFRSVLITWALFSFNFLNIMPIASHAIIEGMHSAVIVLDSQRRIVNMNREALKLASVNLTGVIGQTIQEVFPALGDLFARYNGSDKISDEIMLTLQNTPRFFECQLFPLESTENRRVGNLLWLTDITKRKQAESEIRKLSLAVEQSPTSIVITDKQGHIEYVNQHFIRLTGYTFEEIKGQNSSILKTDQTSPALYKDLWDTILAGKVWTGQFLNKKKNVEEYWEQAFIAPVMDEHSAITHFVAVKEDITQRKQAETEREQLISDLNAYAHTVAHDLKNPISVLMGYSELMLDHYEQMEESERSRYLDMISKTSVKMYTIIDELLLLSSVRTQANIRKVPLEMQKILKESLQRLDQLIKDNQAEVTIQGEMPTAYGYAGWIEEVWVNYLSNAVKYGGKPSKIVIGADVQPGKVRFWVQDNGQGLNPDQQAHLFQEFSRVTPTPTEGHGLGLSIVRRIVEKLGGQVGVTSEIGKGSTFFFELATDPGTSLEPTQATTQDTTGNRSSLN
jgi:PAS domain S-box-containing protein